MGKKKTNAAVRFADLKSMLAALSRGRQENLDTLRLLRDDPQADAELRASIARFLVEVEVRLAERLANDEALRTRNQPLESESEDDEESALERLRRLPEGETEATTVDYAEDA